MNAAEPAISVVVATHDRAARLERLIEALERQTLERSQFELIIVDDGSTDGTSHVLDEARGRTDLPLTVIRRPQADGPATAREDGWRAAGSALIAFTDDDCEPSADWLECALAAAEMSPGGFIQGRTEPNPSEINRLGPFSRTIDVGELDPNFHTCNIVYPRELLERIDGFDTDSFDRSPGGEDSDLAWRAIGAGAQPIFEPKVLVYHAVNELGPAGKLRVAARWSTPMKAYALHPELRQAVFTFGVFWKLDHFRLSLAVFGLALPRRWWPLKALLTVPFARSARARSLKAGRGSSLAPYFLVHDLIELAAVARAAVRYRTLML